MRTLAALLLLALAVVPAAADTVAEPRSETEFPARVLAAADGDTVALEALGTGLRTKWGVKVYAACLYVVEGADLGEDRCAALIRGAAPRRIVMHFLRDVEAGKVAGAFREGIRKTLPEGRDEAVDAFCGLFTEDMRRGEEIVLTQLPAAGLVVERSGARLGAARDAEVAAAVWATWFGDDPISGDMKRRLAGL
ncbi:MAG: chalcone isomerase family protein [Candidatus Krumholzibacteriota bacterium]|nr:chalcone isomerase family protein [Candidatus Krumholzibacteriota bacterium]